MNVKNLTGPLVFAEYKHPISGKIEVVAVRFETIEMDAEEHERIQTPALSNVEDPRLILLRNYMLQLCALTPHVIPTAKTVETDNQDDGQQLGG